MRFILYRKKHAKQIFLLFVLLAQSSTLTSFDFFIKTASRCTFGTHILRLIYLSPEGIPGVGSEHLQGSTVGHIFTP